MIAPTETTRRIAIVTGSRAEFGLLRPLMRAIAAHDRLELRVFVCGSHLLPPTDTANEVAGEFDVVANIPMQIAGATGRAADAAALGRGITGFANAFAADRPDVVVVLGDRIEAFAAAAAASVSGIRVAHLHGGDRAEGVADEAMRHAITKLSHIHLPATQSSAMRIIAMGEERSRVHIVGSPAIDGVCDISPMAEAEFRSLGSPQIIVLLHPVGDEEEVESDRAWRLLSIARAAGPTLVLHPNHDPGRDGIMQAIVQHERNIPSDGIPPTNVLTLTSRDHLSRDSFIGLLRRVRMIVGNSSAGLIECAALPLRAINIGRRQAGRELPTNVTHIPEWDYQTISDSIQHAIRSSPLTEGDVTQPYGDGHAGIRTAELLATFDPAAHSVTKRNAY